MVEQSNPVSSANQDARATTPNEPFACPACGQMLGPAVRVCVACKAIIDEAKIPRPRPARAPLSPQPALLAVERTPFPWQIFVWVLASWFLAATVAQKVLGPAKAQLVLLAVVFFSSAWVFLDARQQAVPKPLRWSLGSLLLWIIVFPWYLAREKDPRRLAHLWKRKPDQSLAPSCLYCFCVSCWEL
jgi:hypothetical protein